MSEIVCCLVSKSKLISVLGNAPGYATHKGIHQKLKTDITLSDVFLYKKQELEPDIGPLRSTLNVSRTAVVFLMNITTKEVVGMNLVDHLKKNPF